MKSSALLGASVAALFAGSTILATALPRPAEAKNGLGKAIGVGVGIAIVGGALSKMKFKNKKKRYKKGVRRKKKGTGKAVASDDKSAEDYMRETKNFADEQETRRRIQQNETAERNRDVPRAVGNLIYALKREHGVLRANCQHSSYRKYYKRFQDCVAVGDKINQVTAGEIQRALDSAYKTAHLTDFDRFSGELWTRDRLKVRVLQESIRGIAPYFKGVGAQGPSMSDLRDDVFVKAARLVNSQALELSEIIGVSHSFDRFIRTIYENSDRAPESLQTIGADAHYERLLSRTINQVDRKDFIRSRPNPDRDPLGLERQFQYQFRARRVLYDCLSRDYANLATDAPGGFIQARTTGGRGAQGAGVGVNNAAAPAQSYQTGGNRRSRSAYQPVATKVEVQAPVEQTVDADASLWDRVKFQVKNKCWQPTSAVAAMAKSQEGMRPVPARWNSASAFDSPAPQYGGSASPVTVIPRIRY